MDSRWTRGHKNKEARKKQVLSYNTAFTELGELLTLKEPQVVDYESPAWAYKRADLDGYNRAIEDVLRLISIKE